MIGCAHPFTAVLAGHHLRSGAHLIRVVCVCCGSGKEFHATSDDEDGVVCTTIRPDSVWARAMSRVLELNETVGRC